MAEVPDTGGVPTVAPDTRGISVQATPEEAGGLIAAGLEKFGTGAQEAGKFYGQIAASDAATTYVEGADAIRGKLRSLEGKAALDYLPEAQQQLNDLYKDTKGSLWTADSALQFDNEARRYHANTLADIADYGATVTKQYGLQTADRQVNSANAMAATATLNNDGVSLAQAVKMARDAESNKMRLAGNADDPGAAIEARDTADRGLAIARIQAVVNKNPPLAKQIFDANQNVLAGRPEFEQLQRQIEDSTRDYMTGYYSSPAARAAFTPVAPAAGASANDQSEAPQSLKSAIIGQESGGNPRAPISADGAIGPGQMKPETFHQFANPGEDINKPADNMAVASRAIDSYSKQYDGDASRVAVAYFSGPGNVAPVGSATPYLHDYKDGNGKSVSSYVADVQQRLGGAQNQPSNSDDAYLTYVRAKAEAAGLGPAAVESVVKGVETNIKRDNSEQVLQTEAHTQDAIAYLSAGGDASKVALTPDQVRANIPGQRGDTLATELEAAQHYNTATKQLATAPQADVDKIILAGPVAKSLKGGAGDFDIHTKEENAIYAAAVDRQKEIYGSGNTPGDPSGYVMRNFPDVDTAFRAATAPGAPLTAFPAYAQKTLSAQAALGIPADARRVMPRAAAVGTVAQLMTGDPAMVLPTLQGLRNEAGSYWPQMYGDLARAGLPPAYQALSVVNDGTNGGPNDAAVMAAALSHDASGRVKGKPPIVEEMRGVRYDDGSGAAPKSVTDLVDLSLSKDGGLTNLKATYGVAGVVGAAQFSGIYDAVRTTALYLFQTRGIAPDVAAQTAAKMVTSPFDFVQQPGHPPVRLPKGATDNFRTAAPSVVAALTDKDVLPYAGSTTEAGEAIAGQTDAELRDQTLQGARHAFWIAVPGADGRGSIRAMDPQSGMPVQLQVNTPDQFRGTVLTDRFGRKFRTLDVPMARLPWLAQETKKEQRQKDAGENTGVD